MDTATFAERLKVLVDGSGMTKPELAARARISQAGLYRLLKGQRSPTLATLGALARALNKSLPELLS